MALYDVRLFEQQTMLILAQYDVIIMVKRIS